jgi:hypothetical protein
MAMLPPTADPQQRHVLLGFADGSVRLVARCSDGWAVLAEARPHKVRGPTPVMSHAFHPPPPSPPTPYRAL